MCFRILGNIFGLSRFWLKPDKQNAESAWRQTDRRFCIRLHVKDAFLWSHVIETAETFKQSYQPLHHKNGECLNAFRKHWRWNDGRQFYCSAFWRHNFKVSLLTVNYSYYKIFLRVLCLTWKLFQCSIKHCTIKTSTSGGTAPVILNLDIKWRWITSFSLRPVYSQKNKSCIVQTGDCRCPRDSLNLIENIKAATPTSNATLPLIRSVLKHCFLRYLRPSIAGITYIYIRSFGNQLIEWHWSNDGMVEWQSEGKTEVLGKGNLSTFHCVHHKSHIVTGLGFSFLSFCRYPLYTFTSCPHVTCSSTTHNTNIHAVGGIRTRNLSKRAATDVRLKRRDHRDRSLGLRDERPATYRLSHASPTNELKKWRRSVSL